MNLLEKIDMFYKMAQKLEENPLGEDSIENIKESPKNASVKERLAKLAKLTKRS
jgi:hypothetical protein